MMVRRLYVGGIQSLGIQDWQGCFHRVSKRGSAVPVGYSKRAHISVVNSLVREGLCVVKSNIYY